LLFIIDFDMSGVNSREANEPGSGFNRDQLLTIGDLEDFKKALLVELKDLLKGVNGQRTKKWLRSSEVRKMLGVSPGTLQNLRINRILTFSKIGGIVFYKHDDIINLLEKNSNPKDR
jgi:hypothetical protein